MATPTVDLDSHQTCTSDEQTVKLSSEAVKVREQINLSLPQETVEDDREKGKADSFHIPDSTLSTSEEKAVDEVNKTDETPVVDLPVHDNEKLEKESTSVAEVATAATAANETVHEDSPLIEPVGGEAIELPVIAYLEKSIQEFDATECVKSPPEEQPTAEVTEKEALEVPPATASPKKVEEQPSEAVGLPKSEDESSGNTVDRQEKEKPGASVQSVIEVAEEVETVPVSVEGVEEKKPKIIDNPEVSVVANSGKCPAEAEEEPATKFASVEKEPDKEPESGVPEESVEPPKKEAQPIEVIPVKEPIEAVAKEIIEETVEPPAEKEQPVEVHPIKGLEEVIAKEISEAIEVSKEKEQASEVEPGQESREVIEIKISESVEVPQESELLIEVHPEKELVIDKETNESIELLENKEQPDEVISQKELVEVISIEVSASSEPPKNKEEAADGGISGTESGEVKEKETSDSTLGSEEVEKQEKEVIEVKDDIGELPKITKHVQDTYVEAETVKDEKPLAPGDDIVPPIEGKIQEEEGSDKQDSVGLVAKSGSIEDSVKGSEKEQPATDFASVEEEPKEEPETTCVPEVSVESRKKEAQPSEVVPVKEPVGVVAKEVIETVAPPTEKGQSVEVANEISEMVTRELIEIVEPQTEKEQPVGVANEISEVVAKEVIETVEPPKEKEQPVEVANEVSEVVAKEVIEMVEPPTEKEQPVEVANEVSVVVEKEVIETVEPPTEEEQPAVVAKEASESIEPLQNKAQQDEVISQKESVKIPTQEVSASFDRPKNNEQTDESFPVTESGLEEEHPAKEFVSEDKELREEPETTPVPDLFVEPPKKEEQPIEVPTVEEQEVITKEIIETIEPPTDKEQPIEVHPLKESGEVTKIEITETTELPKEKEETNVHPVQESREVIAEKISETVEIPNKNELLTEVHPVQELEVIEEGTSESIEPPKNEEQPDKVISEKESLEVIGKEVSASYEPPKNKEQPDEGFPVTEFGEGKGKETIDSTLGSEEAVKQEPEVFEVKDSVRELPEITKHVQDTYVEVETVKDKKALVPEDDINPPIGGGTTQEEEAQYAVESDKQVSEGQGAKSGLIEDSGKDIEKEQPAEEFVIVDRESTKELETHVPELPVEPPKKEGPVEVLPAEQAEVIEKEIIEAVDVPTGKEQPIGVHPPIVSGEGVEKEITEPTKFPRKKEQATEESKEVIAEKISESVEIPKESELLIEVQPVKEVEVVAGDTSESIEPPKNQEQPDEVSREKESEVIATESGESFIPPKNMGKTDEGFPVIESEEVEARESSGSKLGPEEVEKRELEVTEVKDGKEEFPEITNHVQNVYVKVETEAIEKDDSVEGEKPLALGDDSAPPLAAEEIHKEEEQCTVQSDRQDSPGLGAQLSVEFAAGDFLPLDVKGDEKKESSNINVVAKSSELEAIALEKVGEKNEEKIVETEKADEDKYERLQELTLPREELTPRDFETDAVVVEKSTDDQKAGEVVDLIAETKIEESPEDEKTALDETGNAHVNETHKEPQEPKLEVKDKETVITGGEVPKENDKKEVPSKPSHKHSHNILSKVKQSLVKAKKAIIGKSPSSKTLSSEARDDIKVK